MNTLTYVMLMLLTVGAKNDPNVNKLVVRASPPIQLANIGVGCGQILMTVEIKGPESEEWYCPKISWGMPDGTVSTEESDCPLFEKRNSCLEPQEGCGNQGFKLDRATGRYVDQYKECPCTIIGYPRRWTKYVCAPPHPNGLQWEVKVKLQKGVNTLATGDIRFLVR